MSSPIATSKGVLWDRLFQQENSSAVSLQSRVRQMLISAILSGHLPPGSPVPSSRLLADQLQIARNTVVFAYQQLVSEGYLVSRERSGHFVCDEVLKGRLDTQPERAASQTATAQWDARMRLRPSRQRNITKPPNWQKMDYPFVYGQFDPELFPTAEWRECCTKALSVLDIRSWAPDLITHDDPALIEEIRTQVLPRRGVWASADEIVVTVGAQHALYLLADLLMHHGTVVGVEDPGYPDARNIFLNHTRHVLPLPVDSDGLCLGTEISGCDYIFTTPSHQCPTGVTMTMARRQELLQRAIQADCIIIEDDFEIDNRYADAPIPALKSLDQDGRVIYVGSLSKSFAPGLRIGYVVAPPALTLELRALRRLMLRHPSAYIQRAFALFISLGHHHSLLRKQSEAYQERSGVLQAALASHMPEFTLTPHSGGSSCWLRGPEWLDTEQLAAHALQAGVVIEPGKVFFADETRAPGNYIRMGYTSIPASRIGPGIERLSQVARSLAR